MTTTGRAHWLQGPAAHCTPHAGKQDPAWRLVLLGPPGNPENIPPQAVIDYELPLPEIISRLSGRRTCSQCKAVFHINNQPPKIDNICDHLQRPTFPTRRRSPRIHPGPLGRLQQLHRSTHQFLPQPKSPPPSASPGFPPRDPPPHHLHPIHQAHPRHPLAAISVAPALLPVFLQSKPHLLSSLFPLTHRYISDALPNPLKFHTNSTLASPAI